MTLATERKSVRKKKGTAMPGAASGLTRKRITNSDAEERSAAAAIRTRMDIM
jgi:hypothetical protein